MVTQDQRIKKNGVVIEALPSATFKVKLEDESEIIAHLSGRLRINRIRILVGDKVKVEMSPYDNKRGRVIYRESTFRSSAPHRRH
ncbi:MAG: translation initiation factor IF-1 [bacterium]|nr:translation initiation factor IF-1 [bacterium]